MQQRSCWKASVWKQCSNAALRGPTNMWTRPNAQGTNSSVVMMLLPWPQPRTDAASQSMRPRSECCFVSAYHADMAQAVQPFWQELHSHCHKVKFGSFRMSLAGQVCGSVPASTCGFCPCHKQKSYQHVQCTKAIPEKVPQRTRRIRNALQPSPVQVCNTAAS